MILGDNMLLSESNIRKAMVTDGYQILQMGAIATPTAIIYLGDPKTPSEIRTSRCSVVLTKQLATDPVTREPKLGDLKIHKQYNNC